MTTTSNVAAPKAESETPPPPMPDPVGDALIAAGLSSGAYDLWLNRKLQVPYDVELPYPWNLPSRLLRFPIEVGDNIDGDRKIALRHPALKEHPWVKHVETVMGIDLQPGRAPNRHGVSDYCEDGWSFAGDLMSPRMWTEVMKHREFCSDRAIKRAIEMSLHHERGIGVSVARHILSEIGSEEPMNAAALLCALTTPWAVPQDSGPAHWPVNSCKNDNLAWTYILGLENGWLDYLHGGYIAWTEIGKDRYHAGADALFVQTSTGQGAFAF